MTARSPIEAMIDAATGFDPAKPAFAPLPVVLRCPSCKREASYRQKVPDGTTLVVAACPKCAKYPYRSTFYGAGMKKLKTEVQR